MPLPIELPAFIDLTVESKPEVTSAGATRDASVGLPVNPSAVFCRACDVFSPGTFDDSAAPITLPAPTASISFLNFIIASVLAWPSAKVLSILSD